MKEKSSSSLSGKVSFKRKCVQLYAALLYNCNLSGFVSGKIYQGNAKRVCVPGLNCYSCPGAVGACPLGSLQSALAKQDHSAFFYVFGMLGLFALLLGRTVCGWLCPVGLLQELVHKIPTPKVRKSRLTRFLSYTKYVVLAGTVLLIPLLMRDPGFCKYICPAGTIEGAGGLLLNGNNSDLLELPRILFTNKLIIAFILFLLCVFVFRAFCRFICPLGALYGFFNRISLIGVRVDRSMCTGCGACVRKCKMDVRRVGDRECINCGECMDVCAAGAITLKAGRITLLGNDISCSDIGKETTDEDNCKAVTGEGCRHRMKKRSAVIWGLALLILAGAVVYFNFFDRPAEPGTHTAVAEEPAPDFSVALLDGETFTLSQHRGRIVVINFWASWCEPCCRELPGFEMLQQQYGDDVYVLCADHSTETEEDIAAFISGRGLPLTLNYAQDKDDVIWKLYGDENVILPRTIVIDRDGRTVSVGNGSVTYEELTEMISPLLNVPSAGEKEL